MGYQSVPLDLIAALPHLPFPVYLRRDGRMVLYALPGADPRAILEHAGAGLEIHVPSGDASALPSLLVVLFAQALASRSEPVEVRGRRAVAFATTLLLPAFGPERAIDPGAFIAGQAAVDLLSRALAADANLRRAVVGAQASPGGHRPGVQGQATSEARRLAGRALDGLACAIALATTLGMGASGTSSADTGDSAMTTSGPAGSALLELGRGVAFRDLGLSRIAPVAPRRHAHYSAGGSPAVRSHPLVGARLLAEMLGTPPSWGAIVAGHHERVDGSGYPVGRDGAQLSLATRIAGLADTFASLIAPEIWGSVRAADEAMGVLRIGAGRRFGDDLVAALGEILESGGLLPIRRPGGPGTSH